MKGQKDSANSQFEQLFFFWINIFFITSSPWSGHMLLDHNVVLGVSSSRGVNWLSFCWLLDTSGMIPVL